MTKPTGTPRFTTCRPPSSTCDAAAYDSDLARSFYRSCRRPMRLTRCFRSCCSWPIPASSWPTASPEWCGHGPVLEQDLALANIALDLLGEARSYYQYAAELEGQRPYRGRPSLPAQPPWSIATHC
ncbi:MAG: Phenylacetic acid catabolic protein [Hymenobacter sp.]